MALHPMLVTPDPKLRQKAEPVADDAVRALADDMLATMYEALGWPRRRSA